MERMKPVERLDEFKTSKKVSKQEEKIEKIQVLLSTEDLTDLAKKIAKKSISTGETPESISEYVRGLVRRDLGRTDSKGK